jgi:cytochrome P450
VLLKRVAAADWMDGVADLAKPLSRAIIGDLLGIPEGHRPACAAWSAAIARSLDALPVPEDRPLVAEGEAARLVLGGYIRWVHGEMAESVTVQESSFQAKGLLTLRTRNNSAYKGLYALLRRGGGRDFRTGEPIAGVRLRLSSLLRLLPL